jgi:hypothetical protein
VRQRCSLIPIRVDLLSRCGLRYRRGLRARDPAPHAGTSSADLVQSPAARNSGPLSSRRESSSSDTSTFHEWLNVPTRGSKGTRSASSSSDFSVFSLGSDDEDSELVPTSSQQGYEMVASRMVDGQGALNTDYDYEV